MLGGLCQAIKSPFSLAFIQLTSKRHLSSGDIFPFDISADIVANRRRASETISAAGGVVFRAAMLLADPSRVNFAHNRLSPRVCSQKSCLPQCFVAALTWASPRVRELKRSLRGFASGLGRELFFASGTEARARAPTFVPPRHSFLNVFASAGEAGRTGTGMPLRGDSLLHSES